MGKYEHIILLSDMDGTLLDSSSKISNGNRKAVEDFIKEGGYFGVATGRCLSNALAFLDGLSINGFCIFANGCQIYDFGKKQYLAEHLLDKEKLRPFLEKCLNERGDIGIEIYTRDLCHIISQPEYSDPAILHDRFPVRHETLLEMMNYEWVKILFCGIDADIKWLLDESLLLEENYWVSRIRSGVSYFEFLPFGVSKGTTVTRLRDFMDKESIIYAVGDYFNDLAMLQLADVGIAVGNAPQELKDCANWVCADNEHDAIADIVAKLPVDLRQSSRYTNAKQ